MDYTNLTTWIQVVLSAITLAVLVKYAADTKRIADVSVSQVENSQVPFLAVMHRRRGIQDADGGWIVQNQGYGPALDIFYVGYGGGGARERRPLFNLAKGGEQNLHDDISNALHRHGKFEMEYRSLSGRMYSTTFEQHGADTRTEFSRL